MISHISQIVDGMCFISEIIFLRENWENVSNMILLPDQIKIRTTTKLSQFHANPIKKLSSNYFEYIMKYIVVHTGKYASLQIPVSWKLNELFPPHASIHSKFVEYKKSTRFELLQICVKDWRLFHKATQPIVVEGLTRFYCKSIMWKK